MRKKILIFIATIVLTLAFVASSYAKEFDLTGTYDYYLDKLDNMVLVDSSFLDNETTKIIITRDQFEIFGKETELAILYFKGQNLCSAKFEFVDLNDKYKILAELSKQYEFIKKYFFHDGEDLVLDYGYRYIFKDSSREVDLIDEVLRKEVPESDELSVVRKLKIEYSLNGYDPRYINERKLWE